MGCECTAVDKSLEVLQAANGDPTMPAESSQPEPYDNFASVATLAQYGCGKHRHVWFLEAYSEIWHITFPNPSFSAEKNLAAPRRERLYNNQVRRRQCHCQI